MVGLQVGAEACSRRHEERAIVGIVEGRCVCVELSLAKEWVVRRVSVCKIGARALATVLSMEEADSESMCVGQAHKGEPVRQPVQCESAVGLGPEFCRAVAGSKPDAIAPHAERLTRKLPRLRACRALKCGYWAHASRCTVKAHGRDCTCKRLPEEGDEVPTVVVVNCCIDG